MSERTMSKEEFSAICKECGLEVEYTKIGPGMDNVVAYVSSPMLRDGRSSFAWWSNYVLSNHGIFYGFYEALWRETSTGKYTLNGNDLGDCLSYIKDKEELREVCLNTIDALKRLERDESYRQKHIDLNRGKYERETD